MKIKLNRLFQFLSSVKLAIPLISILMLSIAAGTILESRYNADFAKFYIYDSFLFYVLFLLLFINILFAALSRIPYQKHHLGFVVTHLGLLILIIGSFMTAKYGIDGTMRISEGQNENKIFLKEFVLKAGTQTIELGRNTFNFFQQKKSKELQILKYIPFSEMRTSFTETQNSEDLPAVGFILKSPLFQNGDMLHLRDKPEIDLGPMRVRFSQKNKKTKQDENTILFIDEKSEKTLHTWNFKKTPVVTFREFEFRFLQKYQNAIVAEKGLIEGKKNNPAVKIEVKSKKTGKTYKEILFGLHPEFSLNQNTYSGFSLRLLDSNAALETLPNGKLVQLQLIQEKQVQVEVFENKRQVLTAELSPGQKTQLPWMGIEFILGNILPHSLMKLEIQDAIIRPRIKTLPAAAVQIQWNNAEYWVSEEYQPREDLALSRKVEILPATIQLLEFQKLNYPGTEQAKEFKSLVKINNQDVKTISMNEPLQIQGYTLYQSSFDLSDPAHPISILSVNKDPGRQIKYLGAIILILGIIIYTLMKSRLRRKQKEEKF